MHSAPNRQACAKTIGRSSAMCSLNRMPARYCSIAAPEQPCGREMADGADPRPPACNTALSPPLPQTSRTTRPRPPRHSARYRACRAPRATTRGPSFRADAQQYRCITSRLFRWRRSGSHPPIQMEAPPPRQVAGPFRHPRGTGSGPRAGPIAHDGRNTQPLWICSYSLWNRGGSFDQMAATRGNRARSSRTMAANPGTGWEGILLTHGEPASCLRPRCRTINLAHLLGGLLGLRSATQRPGWGGLRCNGHRRTDGDGRRSRAPAAVNVFQGHICAVMAHRQAARPGQETELQGAKRAHRRR
jgi:hypothetical protein